MKMKMKMTFNSWEDAVQFAKNVLGEAGQAPGPEKEKPAPENLEPKAPVQAYSAQIAQQLQQNPVPTAPTVNSQKSMPQTAIPTTQRTYTLDELAGAAMTLMDKGMQPQLQELIAKYGVEALPLLPPDQYGSFATDLRGMGAQI